MIHCLHGIRRACVVAAWLLCAAAVPAASAGERERNARVRLTFGVDVPRLNDDDAIRRWVATDLHRRLGLGGNDVLAVDPARPLGTYQVVRLSQSARGVPIRYRESRLLLKGDGAPAHLLGYHSPFRHIPAPNPRLSVGQAASMAGGAERDMSAARLVFWPAGDEVRLSYELDGTFPQALRRTAPVERVYVDASTGEVLDRLSLTHRALVREIRDFALACEREGIVFAVDYETTERLVESSPLVRSETVNGGGLAAERLFDLLGSIHAFLGLALELDSFDGEGAAIEAILGVRYHSQARGEQCIGDRFNAQWHPVKNQMRLPVAALDVPEVVAHELTHGVISSGGGLIYRHQSGALNEAISDAVGVAFAAWFRNGAPRDAGTTLPMTGRDWRLLVPDGSVMRDMRDPGPPYPDHYDDFVYLDSGEDAGGVHLNSSIINHGFYLLAAGGQHARGGPVVEGIGVMQAAGIFGRAAAALLIPNSDFVDARYGFADVAEALYGPASREWVAVHTAMDAIGVRGRWALPAEPESGPSPERDRDPGPSPERDRDPGPSPERDRDPGPSPERDRDPGPSPERDRDPGPSPERDRDPGPETALDPGSNSVLVLSLIASLTLLGAAGLMLRRRPGRSAVRRTWSDEQGNQSPNAAVPVPAGAPRPAPQEEALLGVLLPVDGSRPIPLAQAQLSSRDGLVIGRNRELCHVEIGNAAVSRRHLRLRAAGGAILVEDLNSLEGTQVDGIHLKPFEAQAVGWGQKLSIAGLAYRVQPKVETRFRS